MTHARFAKNLNFNQRYESKKYFYEILVSKNENSSFSEIFNKKFCSVLVRYASWIKEEVENSHRAYNERVKEDLCENSWLIIKEKHIKIIKKYHKAA